MASAIVTTIRGSDRNASGNYSCIIGFSLWGADVSEDVEGKPLEAAIDLPTGYTLANVKDQIVAAVQARALELGITVATGDCDLPSYESG